MNMPKPRRVTIDTHRGAACPHRWGNVYRTEGLRARSKIEIHRAENHPPVIALPNVVDEPRQPDPAGGADGTGGREAQRRRERRGFGVSKFTLSGLP